MAVNSWHTADTDELFRAIQTLQSAEECSLFFEDVCTIKEILEIAQRWKIAKMLASGASYNEISGATGVSAATISRVSKCLEYGSGGYRLALERTKQNGTEERDTDG